MSRADEPEADEDDAKTEEVVIVPNPQVLRERETYERWRKKEEARQKRC